MPEERRNELFLPERMPLTGKERLRAGNGGDLPEAGDGKLKLISAFQRVL